MDRTRTQHGVTLMELMVALALTGMLIAAVLTLWGQAQQAYMDGDATADLQQQARLAMDQLVRSIQVAGANPRNQTYAGALANDPAFVAFREAGPNCIRLYADLDGNGDVVGARENLSYTWNGAGIALTEQAGGGPDAGQVWVAPVPTTQDIATNLANNPAATPMFQYFTGNNDATPNLQLATPANTFPCTNTMTPANRARIGRVIITITTQTTLGTQTISRTLVSEARPRNVP